MKVNEINQAIDKMNPVDIKLLTDFVEERKNTFQKQEISELIKRVCIMSYASYVRDKVEIFKLRYSSTPIFQQLKVCQVNLSHRKKTILAREGTRRSEGL